MRYAVLVLSFFFSTSLGESSEKETSPDPVTALTTFLLSVNPAVDAVHARTLFTQPVSSQRVANWIQMQSQSQKREDQEMNSGGGFAAMMSNAAKQKKKRKKGNKKIAPTAYVPSRKAQEAGYIAERAASEERGKAMLEAIRSEQETSDSAFLPAYNFEESLTPDEMRALEPGEGVMPEEVSNRMLSRILPGIAVPIVLGTAWVVLIRYLIVDLEWDISPQIGTWGSVAGLIATFLGVTFGVLTTNFEEGGEQTLLGTENIKNNWEEMTGVDKQRAQSVREYWNYEDTYGTGARKLMDMADKKTKELKKNKYAGVETAKRRRERNIETIKEMADAFDQESAKKPAKSKK